MKKNCISFIVGFLLVFLFSINVKAQGYAGAYEYCADDSVRQIQKGIMPSKGKIESLVFLVDFPDAVHDGTHTKDKVEAIFFEKEESVYRKVPGMCESLTDFYESSSYGQLQISGQVFGWYTAKHERDYYARTDLEYPMVENLFWEVIEAYDSSINFSKYDKNNDGFVDSVYLVYSGGIGNWGETFWTYTDETVCTDKKDGKQIAQYGFINENSLQTGVLAHETGHMMGLIDYYDYDKLDYGSAEIFGGNYTLMLDNCGDLDAWSKILLGWVKPSIVTADTIISLRPSNTYGDVAIVHPKQANTNSFFVIEFANPYGYSKEDRLRIYRINYTVGANGGFKYGVAEGNEINTVELVYDSLQSDAAGVSPYSRPASYLSVENADGTFSKIFSGISIQHGEITSESVSVTITYEELNKNRKPSYELISVSNNNRCYLELNFDIEMYWKNELKSVMAFGGGKSIPLMIGFDRENNYYIYSHESELSPNTTYSFTIPKGCLNSYYGGENDEIFCTFTTDCYIDVVENAKINKTNALEQSEIIALTDNTYGIFGANAGKLYLYQFSSKGSLGTKTIVNDLPGVIYQINACKLDDGDIVIAVVRNVGGIAETDFYRMKPDGTTAFIRTEKGNFRCMYSLGENVLMRDDYVCLLKKDNSFKIIDNAIMNLNRVQKYQDNIYLISDSFNSQIYFVDSNFNIIRQVGYSYLSENSIFVDCGLDYNGYFVGIGSRSDQGGIIYYDENYKYLGQEFLDGVEGVIYPIHNGFVTVKWCNIPIYNEQGVGALHGWITSPISIISFYNMNFDKLYSYTLDDGNLNTGEIVESVCQLNNGDIVVTTGWSSFVFSEIDIAKVDITHPGEELKREWASESKKDEQTNSGQESESENESEKKPESTPGNTQENKPGSTPDNSQENKPGNEEDNSQDNNSGMTPENGYDKEKDYRFTIPVSQAGNKVAAYQGCNFYEDGNGNKRCYKDNGVPVVDEFKCDGTYTYYFQLDGTCMKNRLTYHPDGEHVIYLDENGHEVFSNFVNVKQTIEGKEVDDYCFFDVYGHLYVDVVTFDQTGTKLYYANQYGVMERGKWFEFSDTCKWADGKSFDKAGGKYGYAMEDGSLMTNTYTYDWEGRLCYMQGNGVAKY